MKERNMSLTFISKLPSAVRRQSTTSLKLSKPLATILCLLSVLLTSGCLFTDSQSGGGGTPRLARLSLTLQIGADGRNYAPAALGKPAVTLARAVVTMTAANGEVVRDTITRVGSRLSREPAYLNESTTYSQELFLRYEIKPSAFWKVDVKVLDTQDSVRYAGSLDIQDLNAFEYLDGCLPVEPRYAVVEGRFRLREHIEADGISGSARALRKLYHTRLEILVDKSLLTEAMPPHGMAALDDPRFTFANSEYLEGAGDMHFFKPSITTLDAPIIMSHEYGSVRDSVFLVSNYGYVQGDTVGVTPERLLFQGTMTLNLAKATVSDQNLVQMTWKATDAVPVYHNTGMDVRLGRAGKVVIQVIIPSEVPI
jgi:hypothetical protein